MKTLVLAFAAAVGAVAAFERPGYTHLGRSNPTDMLQLMFGVKRQSPELVLAALERVSDPRSPQYGQHLHREEVLELIAPKPESLAVVKSWLRDQGVLDIETTPSEDYVTAYVTIEQAERLLSTEYHAFQLQVRTGRIINRCETYLLPAAVDDHVDFVAPTTNFPLHNGLRVHTPALGDVDTTPAVIREIYGIGDDASTVASNKQQAAGFLQQYTSASDANSFFKQYSNTSSVTQLTIVGPNDGSNPGDEADLDVQYLMAIGNKVNTTYWYTDGQRPYDNEPFLVWLTNLTSLPDDGIPHVISVSYGDNENTIEMAYAVSVTTMLQALGARGVSVMFSSGDGGVAGSQPGDCPTGFIPTFPAASPYVTAVGATTRPYNESAAQFSSGGFSNFWARPSYQAAAVTQYFSIAKSLPSPTLYNHTGAGFPDVAAIGTNFLIILGGSLTSVAGTSCSSPTFAGMVSLLNDHRLAAGKSTLGWLNPLLYQHPELFHQITEGSNPGCNTKGFYAAPGWSPVTGLGSLNYTAALALVMSLP